MADPTARQMLQMITGSWVTQIVGTLAALAIPDQLAAKRLTPAEVAEKVGCDPHATSRLLRGAASLGLATADHEGRYDLTPLGETLRAEVPGSMRDMAIVNASPGHWLPMGRLRDAVRSGRRQTVAALGSEVFDYYAANPAEARHFTAAMNNLSSLVAAEVARVLDTSQAAHAVDVGGASGTIISALLEANPKLTGAILEIPHTVAQAEEAIARRGLADRCRVIAGDFFAEVPAADLYVIKHILHDWDDAQCVHILRNCARALSPGGRVAVVEILVPDDGRPSFAPLLDLNMLALTPGRERTAAEYEGLLRSAGLRLDRVIETNAPAQVIEASAFRS
jgi:predicted O-methyltransferase YrrM